MALLPRVFVLLYILPVLLSFTTIGSAAPSLPKRQGACTNPVQRKEWRKLTTAEKADYIRAVKCLHEQLPAITTETVPGAVSRFDDFIGVHKLQTPYIHFVGHFLPWHRYFMAAYENTLRQECGYKGGQPYWDYTLDNSNFLQSPVFDPTTGFGGGGSQCLTDGPFKNWVIHVPAGTGTQRGDRCLSRALSPSLATQWLRKDIESQCMAQKDYGWFSVYLEGDPFQNYGIHGGGHFAVGGSAGDVYTSNTEPLFYLHHTNMDRIWAQWQAANPARLTDISGSIRPRNPFLGGGGNLPAGNVTLSFEMNLGKLGRSVKMAEIMNTRGGVLCYEYV